MALNNDIDSMYTENLLPIVDEYISSNKSYSNKQLMIACQDLDPELHTEMSVENFYIRRPNFKIFKNDYSDFVNMYYLWEPTYMYTLKSELNEFKPFKTKIEFYKYSKNGLDETISDVRYRPYIYYDTLSSIDTDGIDITTNTLMFNFQTPSELQKSTWKYGSLSKNCFLIIFTQWD